MILQDMLLVKILGSKNFVVCAREGGANTTPYFPAAHFAKRNTKFGGGGKRGRAKIPSPPTPFLFARPNVRFRSCRAKRGNQSGFCSKKVRAAFSNCDQSKLNDFSRREGCSLAPPSAGLASQKARCFGIKSNGGRSPTRTCFESRRRFGIAKQFTNEICIQFFPFRLRRNTKPIFNPALYG